MAKKIDLDGLEYYKGQENGYVATIESSTTASKAYSTGDYFYFKGKLVKATADIASGGTITLNTNCAAAKLADDVKSQSNRIDEVETYFNYPDPVYESYDSIDVLSTEQSFDFVDEKISSLSYARIGYALVDATHKYVRVSKTAGASFAVGFTASNPQNNTALISGYITDNDTGSEITAAIPSTALYVVFRYWRSSYDTGVTSSTMAASIKLEYVFDTTDRSTILQTVKTAKTLPTKNVKSRNLFNGKLYSGYVSAAGLCASSASYKFTDSIDVSGRAGETLYFSINGTATNARFVCAFNGNIPVSASGSGSNTPTYTVPSGITRIIPSFATPVDDNLQIEFGGITAHEDFTDSVILGGYPAVNAFANIGNQITISSDSLANNAHVSDSGHVRIKANGSTYAMYAKIGSSGLGTDGYLIFGRRQYEIGVNNTNLMYFTTETSQSTAVAHGLTLKDYVFVTVTIPVDSETATITIYTNGGTYTRTNTSWAALDMHGLFSVYNLTGNTVTDVKCTWSNSAIRNRLCVMGDSYITYSDKRWPYYIRSWGYKQVLYSGYSGENSENGFADLLQILRLGKPSIICWCYGLNDGDSGAINANWLKYVNLFLHYCEVNDITPILATIPCVSSVDNSYKNAWVRASGKRYIEFANAVNETQDSTTWYDNMLSTDNVHPDTQGAIALAAQFLVNVPEVAGY